MSSSIPPNSIASQRDKSPSNLPLQRPHFTPGFLTVPVPDISENQNNRLLEREIEILKAARRHSVSPFSPLPESVSPEQHAFSSTLVTEFVAWLDVARASPDFEALHRESLQKLIGQAWTFLEDFSSHDAHQLLAIIGQIDPAYHREWEGAYGQLLLSNLQRRASVIALSEKLEHLQVTTRTSYF